MIEREPDHTAARVLLAQLEDAAYVAPSPPMPPEDFMSEPPPAMPDDDEVSAAPMHLHAAPAAPAAPAAVSEREPREPNGILDDAPLPTKYDVDECVAIPVDPTTLFVYWEVRDDTMARVRASRPGGVLALRLAVIVPSWDGPRTEIVDQDVGAQLGDWFLRNLARGAIVRAAIGWRTGDVFLPLAHSPALETPAGAPHAFVAERLVRWTLDGSFPISPDDADAAAIRRALGRARTRVSERGPFGASERFAGSSAAAFS